MEDKKLYNRNISAPSLITVCIDSRENEEIGGRFYHCYKKEPVIFSSVVEFLIKAERLFDGISYPQASTETRCFHRKQRGEFEKVYSAEIPKKVLETSDIIKFTGEKATFVVWVKFRQNATWQGEAFWMEEGKKATFKNSLELILQMDKVI